MNLAEFLEFPLREQKNQITEHTHIIIFCFRCFCLKHKPSTGAREFFSGASKVSVRIGGAQKGQRGERDGARFSLFKALTELLSRRVKDLNLKKMSLISPLTYRRSLALVPYLVTGSFSSSKRSLSIFFRILLPF